MGKGSEKLRSNPKKNKLRQKAKRVISEAWSFRASLCGLTPTGSRPLDDTKALRGSSCLMRFL